MWKMPPAESLCHVPEFVTGWFLLMLGSLRIQKHIACLEYVEITFGPLRLYVVFCSDS